jgi:NitT/TauT family transport system ATP-binding protein
MAKKHEPQLGNIKSMTMSDTQSPEVGTKNAGSIHVESLSKTFVTQQGNEEVFSDVSFSIEPGSFVTLLGKSGSGKSTLLKIISNVIEATSGQVRFESETSGKATIGHVFQNPRLLPWNTCVQNIEYVHENNPNYSREVAEKYLDLVDLSDQYDKYPTQLSGGQEQRVGIARAFSIDPDILLMDEPFSNLDEITAEELRYELLDIWEKLNKTVFFVTHDINEAVQLSDRILMLGEGRIYADIEVPLERPRELDSEEFLKFRQEAINTFHSLENDSHEH